MLLRELKEYLPTVKTPTVKTLAKKHGISKKTITKAVKKGTGHEKEHSTKTGVAREIARDHVGEDPKYYDKLETIESGDGGDGE